MTSLLVGGSPPDPIPLYNSEDVNIVKNVPNNLVLPSLSSINDNFNYNLNYNDKFNVHVAPMMKWTNRHFRYLIRLMSKHTILWTEMVVGDTLVHNLDNLPLVVPNIMELLLYLIIDEYNEPPISILNDILPRI